MKMQNSCVSAFSRLLFTVCIITTFCFQLLAADDYLIGMGIGDVTGPVVQTNMMGYANPAQINNGIHLRLYSRAFIVADLKYPVNRVVFVNVDSGMVSQIVKTKVVMELQRLFGPKLYTARNIMLSSTHSHSGAAGFFEYTLFDITSLGFMNESFVGFYTGILKSIVQAHTNMVQGRILYNAGNLLNSSVNRSPTSYLANPAEERARYTHDTDKLMTVLRFQRSSDRADIGMFSYFAVHGTSMNNTNLLASGDNKGYASQLFEQLKDSRALPGEGKFVAAFVQSNCGDVSPNTAGAKCINSGLPCEKYTSTCHGRNEKCIAFGPGKDMFESTQIIGHNQYAKALELFNSATEEISGLIKFVHQHVNMANYTVQLGNGSSVKTCKPAMGYAFAAGTTDGPGAFDFTQGKTTSNPFWNFIVDLIHEPSEEMIKCQAPKPVLLPTGELDYPTEWDPKIVETQLIQIGQFVLAGMPGEFTTMSGRRVRRRIREKLKDQSKHVVLAGLANVYTSYIATYEEYQRQRYEAASTIYGPHTLAAYLQHYGQLATVLTTNTTIPAGPTPPYNVDKLLGFARPILYDEPPHGRQFGDVLKQPPSTARQGDSVSVTFVSANPRNNMRLGGSYLHVEKRVAAASTKIVANDANWSTRFAWHQTGFEALLMGHSTATIVWEIPRDAEPGQYRITHYGTGKNALHSGYTHFKGATNFFNVTAA